MTPESAVQLIREAMMMTIWLAAPLLLIGFVVGVIVSLFQVATSIQDAAVGAVPKLAALLAGFLLLLPWMLSRITTYTGGILGDLGRYAR